MLLKMSAAFASTSPSSPSACFCALGRGGGGGGGGAAAVAALMRTRMAALLRCRSCFQLPMLSFAVSAPSSCWFSSSSTTSQFLHKDEKLQQHHLSHGPAFFGLAPSKLNASPPPSTPSLSVLPYLDDQTTERRPAGRIYFETYGCQMNVNDMEIVLAIMKDAGYTNIMEKAEEADVIFINTCAIRENAEQRIWQRLNYFKYLKRTWKKLPNSPEKPMFPPKVAVLGCMAERLKEKLIDADKMVDVVCGPDAYRDLPRLLSLVDEGQTGINTLLSLEETYADVSPVRISRSSVTGFVSIMRGCDNMCSYCIVPFTRGRERSRPVSSIIREVGELWSQGVKEVMLLGQNVNSYNDTSGSYEGDDPECSIESVPKGTANLTVTVENGSKNNYIYRNDGNKTIKYFQSDLLSPGFASIHRVKDHGLRFFHLLKCLSERYPEMRFRFTSPHPKDFPDDLLYLMRDYPNVCKSIHLPAQSGSTRILERMRRGYDREAYLCLVERIRSILPDVGISSDFIAGFCGETEEDHKMTLSLIEAVEYDMAYMFAYSAREKTYAHRTFEDDVPEEVKQRRLSELIATFRRTTSGRFTSQIGTTQLVLIEGPNKRNPENELIGRSDKGHKVIFSNVLGCPSDWDSTMYKSKLHDESGVDKNVNIANLQGMKECSMTEEQPQYPISKGAREENFLFQDLSVEVTKVDESTLKPGDYVAVNIQETSLASLRGLPLYKTSLTNFYETGYKNEVSLSAI